MSILFSSLNVPLPFAFSLTSVCVVTAGEWHKLNADVEDAGTLNPSTAWEWVRALAFNLGASATAPLLGRALAQAAWGTS